jgi:hypothetical protein
VNDNSALSENAKSALPVNAYPAFIEKANKDFTLKADSALSVDANPTFCKF